MWGLISWFCFAEATCFFHRGKHKPDKCLLQMKRDRFAALPGSSWHFEDIAGRAKAVFVD